LDTLALRYCLCRRIFVKIFHGGSIGTAKKKLTEEELLWWIRSPAARLAANVVQVGFSDLAVE